MIDQLTPSDLTDYNKIFFWEHFLGKKICKKIFKKRILKSSKKIENKLASQGEGKLIELERKKNLTPEDIKENYIKKGIPVVMEGGAKKWKACKKLTPDFISDVYGNDKALLLEPKGAPENITGENFEYLTLKDVVKNMKEGGKKYTRFHTLFEDHPELREELNFEDLEKFWPVNSTTRYQLFMGGKDTFTYLHNGLNSNVFVQLYGEKEWFLYPMSAMPALNPDCNNSPYKGCEFNSKRPDFNKFPLMRYVNTYYAKLRPGDILFNPPLIWHFVSNLSDSLALGYRWIDLSQAYKKSKLLTLLHMFNTKPNIFWTILNQKADFNKFLAYANGSYGSVKKEEMLHRNPSSTDTK